jgi:hypothetical protein
MEALASDARDTRGHPPEIGEGFAVVGEGSLFENGCIFTVTAVASSVWKRSS